MTEDEFYDSMKQQIIAMSNDKLIDEFNQQVGNKGWTAARDIHDALVLDTLESRGIDISEVFDGKTVSFEHKIKFNNDKTKIVKI